MDGYLIEVLLTNADQIGFSAIAFLLEIVLLSVLIFLTSFLRVTTQQQRAMAEDRREERQQMVDMLNRALQAVQDNSETNRHLELAFSTTSQAAEQTASALTALSQTFKDLSMSIQSIQTTTSMQQETLTKLLEGRTEVFIVVDSSFKIVAISDRVCQIFSCDQPLLGQTFSWRRFSLLNYDGRPLDDVYLIADVIRENRLYHNHIFLHIPHDQPRQWYSVNVEPYCLEDGFGAVVIVHSISKVQY